MKEDVKNKLIAMALEQAGLDKIDTSDNDISRKDFNRFVELLENKIGQQDLEVEKMRCVLEKLQLVVDIIPCTISWVTDKLEYQGVNRSLREICKEYEGQKIGFKSKDNQFYDFANELFLAGDSVLYKELFSIIDDTKKYYTVVGGKYNNGKEGVIIGMDTTKLKTTQKKLEDTEKLVEIDDLTGLYNMRSVYRRIESELARGNRFDHSTGVIMMDMDHFKDVNDMHDHLFGSFVLAEVGKILKKNMRSIDFGARFGGDEFLIVVTQANKSGLEIFCERIRKEIETTCFKHDHDEMYRTVSIGFALTVSGTNNVTAANLVRAADEALYAAKNAGRNRIKGVDQEKNPECFTGEIIKRHCLDSK